MPLRHCKSGDRECRPTEPRPRGSGRAHLLLVSLFLWCGMAQAHEIGTSRVAVSFSGGHIYDVEVVTDAGALAEKLGGKDGLSPAAFQKLFMQADETFRQRVQIVFDGNAVRPEIAYRVEPPVDAMSATALTIHLTGPIPLDARQFTWRFGWTFASYALSVRNGDSQNTQWLDGGEVSAPILLAVREAGSSRLQTALRYFSLGFTHIVPLGLDHVLFVLGIFLLSGKARSVLWQVSAFTVAHSITLGLSLYGLVHVSSRIVEPMIAISIAYVAIENIVLSELKSWRIVLVFAFGLLHGLGFAGALKELGLPCSEFLTALLTFNLGVEAGQLSVIATAFLFVGWHWASRGWYRARVVVPASAMIACIAAYWTFERIFA